MRVSRKLFLAAAQIEGLLEVQSREAIVSYAVGSQKRRQQVYKFLQSCNYRWNGHDWSLKVPSWLSKCRVYYEH